ncbi:protein FAM178B isoform X2 [Odocoileus virginianus]|uniref:Protein FAM178B isoform X2 n=1 Tax=Odocoileus virginianus TaxID=9874 RepID=A0ABM4IRY7_ODOVR
MAGPEKAVLDLPWREDVQAASTRPILLPSLKGSCFDHPLYQGLLHPTWHLCSPTSAPAPKSSKKPKMQAARNTFPNDWSPPPVEFLNLRIPQANSGDPAPRPRGLRRLAHQHPKVSEQEPQDLDRLGGLASLEEPFWTVAGTSPEAAPPGMGAHTSLASGSSGCYVNSLDYLLQEKREQEQGKLLLLDCADLRAWDLNEDKVLLKPEHRKLVERFSVPLQVIPAVHPGETVFLPRRHPVPCLLDSSQLKPRSPLEKLFLSSSPARQLTFLRQGLLNSIYLPVGDRPKPLLRWLLQLLTWPPETSSRAFALLWDLSLDGLFRQSAHQDPLSLEFYRQEYWNGLPYPLPRDHPVPAIKPMSPALAGGDTSLWCPSLQEISATFRSLGAQSPALQPLGPTQHAGSEASLSRSEQQDTLQEMALDSSLNYICKPVAYTDQNLLDLIELLCRAGLDTRLRLLPRTDLQQLLLQLLENIREWPGKLRQLCCALSRVSDHHHSLLALVQLFLDVTPRSRQLRGQLSLLVMARLLNQQERLPLWQKKAQLSSLCQLLGLMRPSSLRRYLGPEIVLPGQEQQPKASAQLDHKVCYLCHSLLTLAGVVVSCQDITPDQWGELQLLCMQLDRHINTHIRESPQAMYRTTLKDLAAQTYIRWQELLARCQPQARYFSLWEDV